VDAGGDALSTRLDIECLAPLYRLIVFALHLHFEPEEQSLDTTDQVREAHSLEWTPVYLDPVAAHLRVQRHKDAGD